VKFLALLCGLAMALPGGGALAAAPQPIKTAPLGMYAGRWYMVGQIAKSASHSCPAATEDFSTTVRGAYAIKVTCREPSGDPKQINGHVAILPNSGNAKFRMSFFGGLVNQEYWMLDHAADQSWALMATPGGNYLWLLTRRPVLDPATRAAAAASIQALGYDVSRLTTDR
jgi:apolipoprotein D and lipocalin family protein